MKNPKSKLRAWDAKDYKVYLQNVMFEFQHISHVEFVSAKFQHIHKEVDDYVLYKDT